MFLSLRPGLRFLLIIVFPMILAASGIMWTSVGMLNNISHGANRQEHERNVEVVCSALASAARRIATLASDNAYWDDAVRNTYGTVNDEWMYETWGVGSGGDLYDAILVVEANGGYVTGYFKGEKSEDRPEQLVGPSYRNLVSVYADDPKKEDALSSIVGTPKGPAVVAIAPVLPTSEDVVYPAEARRFLIFLQYLTPELVKAMGEQYIIDGLQLVQHASNVPGSELIRDQWQRPVARAVWQDRKPGDLARDQFETRTFVTLLTLVGIMVAVSIFTYKMMRELANRERIALFDARHDSLSGLPNRAALVAALGDAVNQSERSKISLMYIDLDGFKNINDSYDHDTGDRLIAAISAGFQQLVEGVGFLARLGGDEFGVLIASPHAPEEAKALAQRMLAFVREPFDIGGRIAAVGASIGVANVEEGPIDAAEIMRRADVAMYAAKERGRNQFCHFNDEFDNERLARLNIARELRDHVGHNLIEVAYQPIVDATTRSICGVEALARWPKSSPRTVTPDKFIAIAEEHGLVCALGEHILRKACLDAKNWPHLTVSVNVSPLQLSDAHFVSKVRRIAESCRFDLSRLELEITENFLIKDPARARKVIEELRNAGVRVALDDFGTGYSSVGYLRNFAFDKVKLDHSVTGKVLHDQNQQFVVQGTVLLAAGLSLSITAEGIESEDEAKALRLAGCHELQGYYFGRPQPVEAITALFQPLEELKSA